MEQLALSHHKAMFNTDLPSLLLLLQRKPVRILLVGAMEQIPMAVALLTQWEQLQ
jgi:hypothetical protein